MQRPSQLEKADAVIREATDKLQRSGAHSQLSFQRANAYTEKGEYKKAIDDYNQAIKHNNSHQYFRISDSDAYFRRGKCYAQLGQNKCALDDFKKAIEEGEKNGISKDHLAEIYEARGSMHLDIDKINELVLAENHFTKALTLLHNDRNDSWKPEFKLHPQSTECSFKRGIAYCKQYDKQPGNPKFRDPSPLYSAQKDFEDVLKLNPDHAGAYRWRGRSFARQVLKYDGSYYPQYIHQVYILAIDDYLHAISLDQTNPELLAEFIEKFQEVFNRGMCYEPGKPVTPSDIKKYDLLRYVLDPLWKHRIQFLGSLKLGSDGNKEIVLKRIFALDAKKERTEKIEALCQSLLPTTILGNLFYTKQGLTAPSIEKGTLEKIATVLEKDFTVDDAKGISDETKKELLKNIPLQKDISQHYPALHEKLVLAKMCLSKANIELNEASKALLAMKAIQDQKNIADHLINTGSEGNRFIPNSEL